MNLSERSKRTIYNRIPMMVSLAGLVFAGTAHAQSCAPIEITNTQPYSGNTCSASNVLPYVANGAITSDGPQVIYHLQRGADAYAGQMQLQTQTANADLALFVCQDGCNTHVSCIGASDNGPGATNSVAIPAGAGNYTIIVGSSAVSAVNCGSYTLLPVFPLND